MFLPARVNAQARIMREFVPGFVGIFLDRYIVTAVTADAGKQRGVVRSTTP
jgi:hypothetical protein